MNVGDDRVPMKPGIYNFNAVAAENEAVAPTAYLTMKGTSCKIRVEKLLSSRGASCLTYEGLMMSNCRKVIIKEFYPYSERDVLAIKRSDDEQKLIIPKLKRDNIYNEKLHDSETMGRLKQFLRGYYWQKQFYSKSKFLEIVVEPQFLAVYGDTLYIVSDFHNGKTLADKKDEFPDLASKIHLLQYIADIMSVFEDEGYLYLDICEDNFLIIQQTKERYQLRLFDMDSVISLEELDAISEAAGHVFYHEEYASKLIKRFGDISFDFDMMKHCYLKSSEIIYSLGVLFFKLLFGRIPTEKERVKDLHIPLRKELMIDYSITKKMSEQLMGILEGMMDSQFARHLNGYSSCKDIMKHLNEFAKEMNYKAYISERKTAEANAVFTAYNVLQKYPLFQYNVKADDGMKELNVVIAGKHLLREGFLSAVISIGQMLDTRLNIYLISDDAQSFWESYIAPEKNISLKKAVLVDYNGNIKSDSIDQNLVARALANIHIVTQLSKDRMAELLEKDNCRYFVILDEMWEDYSSYLLEEIIDSKDKSVFCGYLEDTIEKLSERKLRSSGRIDSFMISPSCYSEFYSEQMFTEQVYKSGLMAHYYYNGLFSEVDDKILETKAKEYQNDIYSRLSSERTALHGVYKMASVGLDPDSPGRFLNYYLKLQDPVVVERLGWLEHLSWEAYLLTNGAYPITTEKLQEYAYQNGNDWKNKEDPMHLGHPLLAASSEERKLPETGWDELSDLDVEMLDPLDKVSYDIYQWYKKQKPNFLRRLKNILERPENPEDVRILEVCEQMYNIGAACIEQIGNEAVVQDAAELRRWTQCLEQMKEIRKEFEDERNVGAVKFLDSVLNSTFLLIRPISDSYRNRDFKQSDRDLSLAVVDLIIG